ncbi:MAG: serine hydrolase domain-containing protein [Actinomycetaceae bacterium]|nr:serine hydrolase domain-containing protein [Actinomycetaceae bacterium]
MTLDSRINAQIKRLQRSKNRTYPTAPTALVSGPKFEFSVGDPDQPFWIASIDKVFIATLIMQLFDEGQYDPDTPIGELLPADDLALIPQAPGTHVARDLTVQHLLSHTSGLPDVIFPPRGYQTKCSLNLMQSAPKHPWKISELLREVEHLPALSKPGERFAYGDTNYLLLMRILEEARGQDFGRQLRARIFEPCEMTESARWVHAQPDTLDELANKLAEIWLFKPGRDDRYDLSKNLTWESGFGGVSTATELVRFQHELHEGKLCDRRWVAYMSRPRHRLRPGIHYGTGLATLRFSGFSPLLRAYPEPMGGIGYTATHMFYYPQQRSHLILNFHSPKRMHTSFIAHIRLAQLIKKYG